MANEWDFAWTDERIWNIWSPCVNWKNPDPERALIIEKMNDIKTTSFLDIGCGGAVLKKWLPESINYVGVDGSDKMIKCAQKLFPGVSTLVWQANSLPFVDKLFDCTLLKHVLEHQSLERFDEVIKEALRVTKKRCIISSFNMPFQKDQTLIRKVGPNNCFYDNIIGEKFLEETIEKYGFHVIEKNKSLKEREIWVLE